MSGYILARAEYFLPSFDFVNISRKEKTSTTISTTLLLEMFKLDALLTEAVPFAFQRLYQAQHSLFSPILNVADRTLVILHSILVSSIFGPYITTILVTCGLLYGSLLLRNLLIGVRTHRQREGLLKVRSQLSRVGTPGGLGKPSESSFSSFQTQRSSQSKFPALLSSTFSGGKSHDSLRCANERRSTERTITARKDKNFVMSGTIQVLDLASPNFLMLAQNEAVIGGMLDWARTYGLNDCSPRDYTVASCKQIHELEDRIAVHVGVEACRVFVCRRNLLHHLLPNFMLLAANDHDDENIFVFLDDCCHLAIRNAVKRTARSNCHGGHERLQYFSHNKITELDAILTQKFFRNPQTNDAAKSAPKIFIIVEGLYANNGSFAKLTELVELRKKFSPNVKLVVDESLSMAAVGTQCRGAPAYAEIRDVNKSVDFIVANMNNLLAPAAAMMLGERRYIDELHRQLMLNDAEQFDAMEPHSVPHLFGACDMVLKTLTADNTNYFWTMLSDISVACHEYLRRYCTRLVCDSSPDSPVKVMRLLESRGSRIRDLTLLHSVSEMLLQQHNMLACIVPPLYYNAREDGGGDESEIIKPGLRIMLNITLTIDDLSKIVNALEQCCSAAKV